jgi:hypothetical protein
MVTKQLELLKNISINVYYFNHYLTNLLTEFDKTLQCHILPNSSHRILFEKIIIPPKLSL